MSEFEALVRQHQAAVCATAYAVLRDRARSEEVAQDAFLIAWRKLPGMSPAPPLPAWICGIARNLARNARRRKEPVMEHDLAATGTPLDAILDREATELADRALAALAESDREVVVLYYRGDQSVAAVATALGVTEPNARQRLHRGRERLRTAVAAVEATLRATRPGPAFTIACVAALATGRATPEASAANPRPWLAIAIGGAIAVSAGVVVLRHERTPGVASAPGQASAATAAPARAAGTASTPAGVRRIGAADRAALAEQIRAALASHGSGGSPELPVKTYDFSASFLADVQRTVPASGGTPKATLRYAIQTIQPMLYECYTMRARPAGTIELQLRLVGDATGTLVESVDLGGDDALAGDADLGECMRETLATIELPAMPEPAIWQVNYPFVARTR